MFGPELSEQEFMAWQLLLEERLGMALPEFRRPFLQMALQRRLRVLPFEQYWQYRDFLNSSTAVSQIEWLELVDQLTIQETHFFRDPDAFAQVEQHLNGLLAMGRQLSLWSLGCSTGEEAYSLAILASEACRQASDGRFAVYANDISSQALAKARLGCFSDSKLANLSQDLFGQYFEYSQQHSLWQVKSDIRERCCFFRGNLQELHQHPLQNMDVIFCQNVLIYFSQAQKKALMPIICDRLAPGGLLILGPGEYVGQMPKEMHRVANARVLAWQKIETTAAQPR